MTGVRLGRAIGILVVAAGLATVVGTVLPWIRTGGASRNSFDLLAILDRLDIEPDGAARAVIRAWPFVPLLIVVGLVVALVADRRVGWVLAAAGGVLAAVVAAVVWQRSGGYVTRRAGVPMTAVAGSALATLSLLAAWVRGFDNARRGGRGGHGGRG